LRLVLSLVEQQAVGVKKTYTTVPRFVRASSCGLCSVWSSNKQSAGSNDLFRATGYVVSTRRLVEVLDEEVAFASSVLVCRCVRVRIRLSRISFILSLARATSANERRKTGRSGLDGCVNLIAAFSYQSCRTAG
jgi:hypothetical protein